MPRLFRNEIQFFSFFVSAVLACSLGSGEFSICNPLQSPILHQGGQQDAPHKFVLTRFGDARMFLPHIKRVKTLGDAKQNTHSLTHRTLTLVCQQTPKVHQIAPRKPLESSAPLGLAASGFFYAHVKKPRKA